MCCKYNITKRFRSGEEKVCGTSKRDRTDKSSISLCDSEELSENTTSEGFLVMDVNSIKTALTELLLENEVQKELISAFKVEVEDITKHEPEDRKS